MTALHGRNTGRPPGHVHRSGTERNGDEPFMMRSPTRPPVRAMDSFITTQTPVACSRASVPRRGWLPCQARLSLHPCHHHDLSSSALRRCALPALILSLLAACGEGWHGQRTEPVTDGHAQRPQGPPSRPQARPAGTEPGQPHHPGTGQQGAAGRHDQPGRMCAGLQGAHSFAADSGQGPAAGHPVAPVQRRIAARHEGRRGSAPERHLALGPG